MKLSAYIVTVDRGFAPNPFGHYCTLACCKPTIRRNAEVGDIIVGIAGANFLRAGKLIYAMKVKEVLPFQDYWDDPRFHSRRPTPETPISRCGDNIWHFVRRKWQVEPSLFHDMSQRKRDTSGKNVLVATEFYYFGREAIDVPPRFKVWLPTTQGHKNTDDPKTINDFWKWLTDREQKGRIGDPTNFDGLICGSAETWCLV